MTARANSTDAMPRAGAWDASSLLAFLPAQVVALLAADRLASVLGVEFPEREVVVFTALAAAKVATDSGDFALDSTITAATLATIGAYAAVAVLRAR